MIDINEILTSNLGFSTTETSKKVPLGNYNNNRQPEMAIETENTYVFTIVTDSVKIPTANLRFSTMASSAQ